jgi:hypothetical protein
LSGTEIPVQLAKETSHESNTITNANNADLKGCSILGKDVIGKEKEFKITNQFVVLLPIMYFGMVYGLTIKTMPNSKPKK